MEGQLFVIPFAKSATTGQLAPVRQLLVLSRRQMFNKAIG